MALLMQQLISCMSHSVHQLPLQSTAYYEWSAHTVKTFGLLQPYFGHLGCMPVVCVTHYITSKEYFLFHSKVKCS